MKGHVWKVAVATTLEAEDAVVDLLSNLFGVSTSVYANAKTGRVKVAVYLKQRPGRWESQRTRLRDGLRRARACGLQIGSGRIAITRIKHENWAESWKRHFKPMEIGGRLLIKPSWSRRQPRGDQAALILDPGLSFGTGHHATTSFCLREIVRRRRAGEPQSFLDIGTGSGILALSAARLGYDPIDAFDFDPEAVRAARANASVNGLQAAVRIRQQDVTKWCPHRACQYDLVCANLISTLLLAEKSKIARLLKPDGILVLAGILKSEFAEVQKAFAALGLRRIAGRGEREWYSGAFSRIRP